MANRRFIDFPIAASVGNNDIVLIWQDGLNKQTTKATLFAGSPSTLASLTDVDISALTNGQILQYNSTTSKWENVDRTDIDLDQLGDVTIVSPTNGQVLVYNSSTSKWENSSGGFVPYTGAVTTVNLGAQGLRAGYIRFDTSVVSVPDEQGLMYWDDSRSTVALIMNGTLQHIGQDTFFYVKNSTGSSIAKGTAVRFDGTDGASGHLLIAPFLANGTYPSNYFMGVTAETIANGGFGQVMHFGELSGINTSGYTAGALLYASTTVAGGFQTTAPVAPNNIVLIAAAINSKNNGEILVRPTYGSNINQDEGVKITTPTTGDLLQLQSNGLWENKTKAQVLGGNSSQFVKGDGSLDSTSYQPLLTNPVTGTGTAGQVAFWNGTNSQTGDNGLFWDNTNKRLGVGTNAPAYKTQINSAASTLTMRLQADAGINPTLSFLRGVTDVAQINGAFDGLQLNGSQVIRFDTVATERWRITSTGILQSNGAQTIQTSTGNLTLATGAGNGNILLRPNGPGNVLINTTTDAGFRLDVNGTARVQGVFTTTADAVVNGVNIGRGGGNLNGNTRVGTNALNANTTGNFNTAVGINSLSVNTLGENNTAHGTQSLLSNVTGSNNTALGMNTLVFNTSGSSNVAIGFESGRRISGGTNLTISNDSIFLGRDTRANADNQTNQIVIGHTAIGLGSNTTVLGNTSTTFGRWYGSLLLGTTTNVASSILTMESTTQGFLPPRMTSAQRTAIASPAEGLIVFQTDSVIGLYIYANATWRTLGMI